MFEESKSNDSLSDSSILHKKYGRRLSVSAELIFDDPYIRLISEYLRFPQSQYLVINRFTREFFMRLYFPLWESITKTMNIPGLVPNYDLNWFYGAAGFKDEYETFLPIIFHALVEHRRFTFNYRPIYRFLVENSSVFNMNYLALCQYLLSVEDYELVVDLLVRHSDDFFQNFPYDNFCPLLNALKFHLNFVELYKNLLRISHLKSGQFLKNFLARSMESGVPIDFFYEAFIESQNLLFDVFRIADSIEMFGVKLEIVNKIFEKSPSEFFEKLPYYLTVLHNIRFGSLLDFDFGVHIKEFCWDSKQIGILAEACVLADKLDLFKKLVKLYRGAIVDCFSEDLDHFTVSPKYFRQIIRLLSSAEMSSFGMKFQFLNLCFEYYKIVKIREGLVFIWNYVTFEVEPEYANYGIPRCFCIFFLKERSTLSSVEWMTSIVDQVFKSADSVYLVAPQVLNTSCFLAQFGQVKLGVERMRMLYNIEEERLQNCRHSLRMVLRCDELDVVKRLTSDNPGDISFLQKHSLVKFLILEKLTKTDQFENYERIFGTKVSYQLIYVWDYAKLRLAVRFVKFRKTEPIIVKLSKKERYLERENLLKLK